MLKLIGTCLVLFVLIPGQEALAQTSETEFDSRLEKYVLSILTEGADSIPTVEAVLIAEGVADSSRLQELRNRLDLLVEQTWDRVDRRRNPKRKSKELFSYLHKNILRKYEVDATLSHTLMGGVYNCLTASVLFQYLASKHGVETEFVLSPTHVYVRVVEPDLVVETTDPKRGFDFRNDRDLVNYLLQYKLVTSEEIELIGEGEIYRLHVEGSHVVEPRGVVAAAYYNRAIREIDRDEEFSALRSFEKVILLDPSNDDFIGAYSLVLALADNSSPQYLDAVRRAHDLLPEAAWPAELVASVFGARALELASSLSFDEAESVLRDAKEILQQDSVLMPVEVEVDLARARSLYNRGDYSGSLTYARRLYQRVPDDKRVEEIVAMATSQVYRMEATRGFACATRDSAMAVMDQFPDFPIVADAYVATVVMCVFEADLIRSDPAAARAELYRALELDSTNSRITTLIAGTWYEEAMAKIRGRQYRSARDLILQAIRLDPSNEKLKETLAEIEDLL